MTRTFDSMPDASTCVGAAFTGITLPARITFAIAAVAGSVTRAYCVVATVAREIVALAILSPDHLKEIKKCFMNRIGKRGLHCNLPDVFTVL